MVLHVQTAQWTKDQNINNQWNTVWSLNIIDLKAKFYQAIFELSSSNIEVRLSYNDEIALDLDLNELQQNYKLTAPNHPADQFILTEYFSPNRWILKPPEPFYINVGSSIVIEMKSTQESKIYQAVRGITVWGQP